MWWVQLCVVHFEVTGYIGLLSVLLVVVHQRSSRMMWYGKTESRRIRHARSGFGSMNGVGEESSVGFALWSVHYFTRTLTYIFLSIRSKDIANEQTKRKGIKNWYRRKHYVKRVLGYMFLSIDSWEMSNKRLVECYDIEKPTSNERVFKNDIEKTLRQSRL